MKPTLITILIMVAGGLLLFGLIQLVHVDRTNPAVVTQVKWDSPQTKALFERACADCHSNETVWPAYSNIAPVSWLVAHDVYDGRDNFNISDLNAMDPNRLSRLSDHIAGLVSEGEMPKGIYLIMHPNADLSSAERQALVDGLQKTLANTRAGQ